MRISVLCSALVCHSGVLGDTTAFVLRTRYAVSLIHDVIGECANHICRTGALACEVDMPTTSERHRNASSDPSHRICTVQVVDVGTHAVSGTIITFPSG